MALVRPRALSLLFLALPVEPACKSPPTGPPANVDGCAPEPILPRDLAMPGTMVILGETHGTREVPTFAADLACHALAQGRALVLALEIPASEQARIDRFLASSGDAAARADLVSGEFWTFPMQDGRRSQATVDLLVRAQAWVRSRTPIAVVAFDAEVPPAERDAAMAEHLAAARRARPEALFLVITGGLHAVRAASPDFEPMAARLAALIDPSRVVSLRLAHAGGDAWLCTEECGPHEIDGQRRGPRSIELFDRLTDGFDGEFYVGPIHASPPAVEGRSGGTPSK